MLGDVPNAELSRRKARSEALCASAPAAALREPSWALPRFSLRGCAGRLPVPAPAQAFVRLPVVRVSLAPILDERPELQCLCRVGSLRAPRCVSCSSRHRVRCAGFTAGRDGDHDRGPADGRRGRGGGGGLPLLRGRGRRSGDAIFRSGRLRGPTRGLGAVPSHPQVAQKRSNAPRDAHTLLRPGEGSLGAKVLPNYRRQKATFYLFRNTCRL